MYGEPNVPKGEERMAKKGRKMEREKSARPNLIAEKDGKWFGERNARKLRRPSSCEKELQMK